MFYHKIKEVLFDAINEAFEKDKLHPSALRGVITLLSKKNRDSRYISNMCPITLLNTDYKVIEKMLANRLKPILGKIINKEQKGFMSDRFIGCNIRRIFDIIDYAENNDLPGIILSLDFQSCFDRIEIKSLVKSLEYFNIGPKFQRWTETIYNGTTACINNNGHISDFFSVNRGMKQGGCCSAFYFLIIAEVFAIKLRKNPKIKGILVNDILRILGQFADDTDMYLLAEEETLNETFRVISAFEKHSGFKINYNKTTIYRIGSMYRSNAKLYTGHDVKWLEDNDDINILGITFTRKGDMMERNYLPLLEKSKAILQSWSSRGLSLIGKITIINTLIVSLFVYKMTTLLSLPEKIIRTFNLMIEEFIWDGKKPKIPLTTLMADTKFM